jgi:hypothetical protein
MEIGVPRHFWADGPAGSMEVEVVEQAALAVRLQDVSGPVIAAREVK